MTIDKAALLALCEKATIGAWDRRAAHEVDAARRDLAESAIDAVPALLDALEAAEAREKRLRDALSTISEYTHDGYGAPEVVNKIAARILAETAP